VDSADKRRLEMCKTELHQLLKQERLAGASLLVLANKQDLKGAESTESLVKLLDLDEMANDRHWHIQACSAATGEGLEKGMEWLVDDISSRIFTFD